MEPRSELGRIDELHERCARVHVFARTTAEQKLHIVRAFQRSGHIVAMTGDGVNDAPALREAHVGIAMGRGGTEVARKSAGVVLTDDNFATIVAGIREGRGCLPLTPLMILCINLVTNGLPALALGVEPPDPAQMTQAPRRATAGIFQPIDYLGIALAGVIMGVLALVLYARPWLNRAVDPQWSRAMAFAVLGFGPLFHAWNCRSRDRSVLLLRPVLPVVLVVACLLSAGVHLMWDRIGGLRMPENKDILIVGGYGEVGRRIAALLERNHAGSVLVAGRNPKRVPELRSRWIDVDAPGSIDAALAGVGTIVACVRQREPHLLLTAIRHGLAYTSIAPPWMDWLELQPLQQEAQRTGARIVLATGLEPGIASVLARMGADRLGQVDAVETALLLSVGDAYGLDSMNFILEELAQAYRILVNGQFQPARAFADSVCVEFPAPIGRRRAYTMPFRDQLYYPQTLGARTAIARIAIDPPWVGKMIAGLARLGVRNLSAQPNRRAVIERLREQLQQRYADHNQFSLLVEVRGGGGVVRLSLTGQRQADATAAGAAATAEALANGEVDRPGVWLAEQVMDPGRFMSRLAAAGLAPILNEAERIIPRV